MQSPLRVMVDARMLIGRFSGVGRVVTRLIDALAGQQGIKSVALCGCENYRPWTGRKDIEVVTSGFRRAHRTPCRRALWEETVLPRIIRRAGVDLFHATWNSGVPALCPVPSVLTVHDLIPWKNPKEHFPTIRQRSCYHRAVRASAKRASYVVTVSEYVKCQAVDVLHLDPQRVLTVPNGVAAPEGRRVQPDPAGPPYVLYVGGYEARKNISALFAVMHRYWERYDRTLELRLTGLVGSLRGAAATAYGNLPRGAPVRFLGDVSDDELERQYASAQVLLLLSRDEGFGLPVLEAMAHGCPVIAAARAALPEVVGDAGLLVDPENADEVSCAIRMLIANPDLRATYVHSGRQRARTFSWEAAASRMRSLYERVLGETERSFATPDRVGEPGSLAHTVA